MSKWNRRRIVRRCTALLVAVAAGGGWYCHEHPNSSAVDVPVASSPADRTRIAQALVVLDGIPAKPKEERGDYTGNRQKLFGPSWSDNNSIPGTGHNGCKTNDDILIRQLTTVSMADRCNVATGMLRDPYTGATQQYTHGTTTIQVDHVVSVENAWQTGARYLAAAQRRNFANDPLNLLAVNASDNLAKSSKDFAEWTPHSVQFICTYGAIQIEVKNKYGLWVTPVEQRALRHALTRCLGREATA